MVRVRQQDVELLNQLINNSDKSRDKLMATTLTVYTAITSGLFFLFFNNAKVIKGLRALDKVLFTVICISSLLIVYVSITQKKLSYFSKIQVGNKHAERMRNEEFDNRGGLFPNEWTGNLILVIPYLASIFLAINMLAIAAFMISMLY